MPNKNYTKGVVLEREIVNLFKSVGCTAARTAGSHGKYDLYAIGAPEQITLAENALEIAKFRPKGGDYIRHGQTYIDTLHWMEVGDECTVAVFIQCKRREK